MVMKKKVWAVSVLEDRPFIQEFTSDFYTSDTDANLIIHLTDGEFNPSHATVTLLNTNDESIVSEEHPVKEDTITFPMHTDERSLISHKGTWRFQIIYIKEGEQYTSKIINFSVAGHLLNGEAVPSLERVESWELIAEQAESMLADYEEKSTVISETLARFTGLDEQLEENESERAEAEEGRQVAEAGRVTAENKREGQETTRQQSETERATAEEHRESAETSRAEAEAVRDVQEAERQSNEVERTTAEGGRVSSEEARQLAESDRQDHESTRQVNETAREQLKELIETKLAEGEFDGRDIEYDWRGTELGVRLEGDTEYVYVDLKGDKGDPGEIENLDSSHIVDALGYMPISATDVPELTKENVGLGNVDNVKQASKVEHDQLASDFSEHQADYAQLKGDLSTLKTTAKDSIPNIVNELFTNVSDGKDLVGGAITGVDENVVIPTDPTFNDLATAIGDISSGWSFDEGWFTNGEFVTLNANPLIGSSNNRMQPTSVNGIIYYKRGTKYGGGNNVEFTSYDPMTDTHTLLARHGINQGSLDAIDGIIYKLSDYYVETYDIGTNTWTILITNPTGLNRAHGKSLIYNNQIYYLPGVTYGGQDRTLQIYDIATNTVSNKNPRPREHANSAIEVIGDKAYFIGGIVADVDIYHFLTDTWTKGSPTPVIRWGPSSFVDEGMMYYMYGTPYDGKIMRYDPEANTHEEVVNRIKDTKRYTLRGDSVKLDDKVYFFGGNVGNSTNTSNTEIDDVTVLIVK